MKNTLYNCNTNGCSYIHYYIVAYLIAPCLPYIDLNLLENQSDSLERCEVVLSQDCQHSHFLKCKTFYRVLSRHACMTC